MQEPESNCGNWLGDARSHEYLKHLPRVALCEAANWNQLLSATLFCDISHIELALRNVVNGVLVSRSTRYQGGQHWTVQTSGDLARFGGEIALKKLEAAKSQAARRGPSFSPDDLVSELSLGFWLHFFNRRYKALHPDLITALGGARSRDISKLPPLLDRFRTLRNRIAHHHTILNRDLDREFQMVLDVAGLISAEFSDFIQSHSYTRLLITRFRQTTQAGS